MSKQSIRIENISRRSALMGLVGAGLTLALPITPSRTLADTSTAGLAGAGEAVSPSVYVSIEPSGLVKIIAHRSDMGQGIRTSLPQVLADELEADWSRVDIVQATGDEKYGSQNTDGSRSIRRFYTAMREAGATARLMLERAAAREWGVDVSDVAAREHAVHHAASGRSLDFGALAGLAGDLPVPGVDEITLKDSNTFNYIGKDVRIVDMEAIVTGTSQFGVDVVRPGMKHASIERSPVLFGTVERYDEAAALAVAGVEQVVPLPAAGAPAAFAPVGGVAVIATNTWAAIQGRAALNVQWAPGSNASYSSEPYRAQLEAASAQPGHVVRAHGDVDAGLAAAASTHEADYYAPHLAQAPMEPPMATAEWAADGSLQIWAPTQHPQGARDTLAAILGLEKEQITIHVTLLGGGFGRKSKPDFIVEAALLAREVGAPVKVTWTREDDIRHGYYHSVSAQKLRAGLDERGRVQAWLHRTTFPSIGATFDPTARRGNNVELGMGVVDLPFDIPAMRCENGEAEAHVRIGWLRSVANIYHTFAVGSFVDELAHKAGRDPKAFLLDLIGAPRIVDLTQHGVAEFWNYGEPAEQYPIDTARLRAVIERATDEAGWGRALPAGRGLGLWAHYSFLSYVAVVVEAEVADDGTLSIPRVDMAVDCGTVVNPDRVRAQMEGAAVYGASCAMEGQITARDGAIEQSNFHDFIVARQDTAPREVRVHLLDSTAPPTGVGEPGVPPFIPALTNAVFAASGKRVRDLPIAEQLRG